MWTYESLWKKAIKYASLAVEVEDRKSFLFPFWWALSIELLGRCSLAKVHPSLLAETQQDSEGILFACGIQGVNSPRSISTKQVFLRCIKVVKGFSERDRKAVMTLIEKRNEELHTGGDPFASYPQSQWYPEVLRISAIFLGFIGKNHEDLLGKEEAIAAQKILSGYLANKRDEANSKLTAAIQAFSKLPIETRLERIRSSKEARLNDRKFYGRSLEISCPACEGSARIVGDLIRSSSPKDENGELIRTKIFLPKKLLCYSCQFEVLGYDLLQSLGYSEPFEEYEALDVCEYYGIGLSNYNDGPDYDPTDD